MPSALVTMLRALAFPLLTGNMLCILAGGCASTENEVSVTHTVLEPGKKQLRALPLPSGQIGRALYMSGEFEGEVAALYATWDMNHDGRPDLVVVRDPAGKVTRRLFDFDFDGRPDLNLSSR